MAYILTEVIAGNDIFVHKYHSTRYGLRLERGKNICLTSHAQKKVNKRIRKNKQLWTACSNFGKGDMWVTLTYRRAERPEDTTTAHKNITDIIAKIRRRLKKIGISLFYMCKTEIGEKGAVHHHMLIRNNFDIGLLMELWSCGKGVVEYIYSDSMAVLAEYFTKEAEPKNGKHKYKTIVSCSRNLKKPIIRKRVIKARTFAEEPKPKKGYNIIHTYNGFQCNAGYLYQEYIQTKADPTNVNNSRLCYQLFEKTALQWESKP